MANKRFLMGLLIFGFILMFFVVGCETPEEDGFDPKTINGVWHLLNATGKKSGFTININNKEAILTAADGVISFGLDSTNIGDVVIRNINYFNNESSNAEFFSIETILTDSPDGTWKTRILHYNQYNMGRLFLNISSDSIHGGAGYYFDR